jgi:hypothetical protein
MSQIQVNNTVNSINVESTINTVNVDQNCNNTLVIPQDIVTVVEVVTPGPQGPQGIPGDVNLLTGSFVTTSSFNAFTSSYNTGSFTGSFIGNLTGTASYALISQNSNQITTGSIAAIVDVDLNNLFLIKSGSVQYFNISSSGNTTINSNLFIIKNFTTQQPVLTISQSIVQFATQSSEPTGSTENGSIWFTSTNFYVGLD